jgi:hypothetical protein
MHPPAIPGTPAEHSPAGTHGASEKEHIAAQKAAPKAEDRGPVNVIVDSRGTQFDPALHAAHTDGVTPHVDSFGHFIQKAHHYDGAKKSHYGDTHRHA